MCSNVNSRQTIKYATHLQVFLAGDNICFQILNGLLPSLIPIHFYKAGKDLIFHY